MNRSPLLLLLALVPGLAFTQQGFENCIQVIGATGKTGTQNGLTFTYTVGEPVITTLSGSTRKVTQGFHQPDLCVPVSTNDLDLAAWGIDIYPNPTADLLTVRFSAGQGNILQANVYDLLGRPMLNGRRLDQPDGSQLDCSAWQPGIYILELQDPSTRKRAAVRFIRL